MLCCCLVGVANAMGCLVQWELSATSMLRTLFGSVGPFPDSLVRQCMTGVCGSSSAEPTLQPLGVLPLRPWAHRPVVRHAMWQLCSGVSCCPANSSDLAAAVFHVHITVASMHTWLNPAD
jgi:hypothetical protein